MKSIILSVSPQEALNVLNGKATMLLRKKIPKNFKGWCYLYVSKTKPLVYWGYKKYIGHNDFEENGGCINSTIPARFWFDEYKFFDSNYEDFVNSVGGDFPRSYEENWLSLERFIDLAIKKSCITLDELNDYFVSGINDVGYAIHINHLEIFDNPKSLGEFKKYASEKDLKYCFEESDCEGCKFSKKELECKLLNINSVKNYIYVEEME